MTQEDVSRRVGKDRTTVTNYIRLLKLPPEIQIAIRDNKISMGHARSIINVDDPVQQLVIFRDIMGRQLSVRETEGLVRTHSGRRTKKKPSDSTASNLPFEYRKIQNVLTSQLESQVEVKLTGKTKGKLLFRLIRLMI